MSIPGKYQLERNTHFFEHLVALGVTEDKAAIVNNLKPIFEITLKGNKLTLTTFIGNYTHQSELVLNEEVDEALAIDLNLKSVAQKINDNTIEIHSRGTGEEKGRRRLEFSEHNLIMTIENDSASIPVAKRYYKRIED